MTKSSFSSSSSPSKTVRFQDEATVMEYKSNYIGQAHQIWYYDYSAFKLQAQRPLEIWQRCGYDSLLEDCYQHPHVNVQEYLNAHCRLPPIGGSNNENDADSIRGLEVMANGSHAQERKKAVQVHQNVVLKEYKLYATTSTGNVQNVWERIRSTSRKYSVSSQVFAMRIGRADARAVQLGESLTPALDIITSSSSSSSSQQNKCHTETGQHRHLSSVDTSKTNTTTNASVLHQPPPSQPSKWMNLSSSLALHGAFNLWNNLQKAQ